MTLELRVVREWRYKSGADVPTLSALVVPGILFGGGSG
jgi:hypothetical protein